jgi:uncharacterized protein YggE
MSGVNVVLDALKQVSTDYPKAIGTPEITQISQRTWADDIGVAYSEAVDVSVVFTDFHVMSEWIFQQPHGLFRVKAIDWQLSPALEKEVNIALSVEAVRNARRKAETFATASGLTITGIVTMSDPQLVTTSDTSLNEPRPVPPQPTHRTETTTDEVKITPMPIESEICIWAHFSAQPETTYSVDRTTIDRGTSMDRGTSADRLPGSDRGSEFSGTDRAPSSDRRSSSDRYLDQDRYSAQDRYSTSDRTTGSSRLSGSDSLGSTSGGRSTERRERRPSRPPGSPFFGT